MAQNVDGASGTVTLNSPSNPVSPGNYLVLYLTAQGILDNAVAAGAVAPASQLSSPVVHADSRGDRARCDARQRHV